MGVGARAAHELGAARQVGRGEYVGWEEEDADADRYDGLEG
jgi:hypothetical protein